MESYITKIGNYYLSVDDMSTIGELQIQLLNTIKRYTPQYIPGSREENHPYTHLLDSIMQETETRLKEIPCIHVKFNKEYQERFFANTVDQNDLQVIQNELKAIFENPYRSVYKWN